MNIKGAERRNKPESETTGTETENQDVKNNRKTEWKTTTDKKLQTASSNPPRPLTSHYTRVAGPFCSKFHPQNFRQKALPSPLRDSMRHSRRAKVVKGKGVLGTVVCLT